MDKHNIKIHSKRLTLTPIEIDHAKDVYKEFSLAITKYMFPKPAETIDQTKQYIHSVIQSDSDLQFVILDIDSLEFIGCIGIHEIKSKTPELGIWLKQSAQGKRFGFEASKALVEWAKSNLEFEIIKYPVDKRNFASRNIAEKLGGVIKKEFKGLNQRGVELDQVEYWLS